MYNFFCLYFEITVVMKSFAVGEPLEEYLIFLENIQLKQSWHFDF